MTVTAPSGDRTEPACVSKPLLFSQTYVNTTLYEKFTYAGIDCSAEEAAQDQPLSSVYSVSPSPA